MVICVCIFGYVLVCMEFMEDIWLVVCYIFGVIGFVGNVYNLMLLCFEEVFNMLKFFVEVKDVFMVKNIVLKGGVVVVCLLFVEVDFEVGEIIMIKEGLFVGFFGLISEIKLESGKFMVFVFFFECEILVELLFD